VVGKGNKLDKLSDFRDVLDAIVHEDVSRNFILILCYPDTSYIQSNKYRVRIGYGTGYATWRIELF
jgi:hypothetical protein